MKSLLIILFGLPIISCQNEVRFDSEKWNEKGIDWQLTTNRERMVSDLIESDTLMGMKEEQIFRLLGEPEFRKEGYLEFLIREKYSLNIDPDYIKYLIIELDDKGTVKEYYASKRK